MTLAPEPDIDAVGGVDGSSANTESVEAQKARGERLIGLLLALPAFVYLLLFFAVPLAIVVVYSFATRNRFGGTDLSGWNIDSYREMFRSDVAEIIFRSVWLAGLTTVICLLIAYPFAYFMATRSERVRNLMLVLVMIPFWTNFLVRNYAWRVILGTDGPLSQITEAIGLGPTRLLFTISAVVLGLVYGFLPFMILPLYASIERIDGRLMEAARDLYAGGFQAFRRVLLPLSTPGVIAGSILVFVPSLGAYVTPEILGFKKPLLGTYIVTQFLTARNWPFGAALSFVLMAIMLLATIVYFRRGGRTL